MLQQVKSALPEGIEQTAPSTGNATIPQQSGAKSGAHCAPSVLIDADLRMIVDAWGSLSAEARAEIAALVGKLKRGIR